MMAFLATPEKDYSTWDFITGDVYKGMSIALSRYEYLYDLNSKHELKLAFKDPDSDKWTKWKEFPGLLWQGNFLTAAIDVHRSVLSNEIVIESDYPNYEENYEAAKLVGRIIEEKGFRPLYYFSGNKSIHIHVFFDWNCLKDLDAVLDDQLRVIFKNSKLMFQKKFMEWLREKMISCWDTNAKKFDKDLVRATHLIRCELSKNKQGYKTFLGYNYKDLSFVPYICNESNRIYPKLGEIMLSQPEKISELIQEFIESMENQRKRQKRIVNHGSLDAWTQGPQQKTLRNCVKSIMDEEFKKVGDGYKRSMFILLNELKSVFGEAQAMIIMNDWNAKMGFPVKEEDIKYRLKQKSYTLSCSYIHNFLKELGIDVSGKCKGKVYK